MHRSQWMSCRCGAERKAQQGTWLGWHKQRLFQNNVGHKHELPEVANQMYRYGQISDNQKHGMLVCVPKKPRTMRTDDYRHLTLLNTDFKLLSRIITNRIRPWTATILHPSQYCGIQGHNIFEAIVGVREAIAYTECTRSSIFILSQDFKEAFDKISHDYLLTVLGKYGFSSRFQQYIEACTRMRFLQFR